MSGGRRGCAGVRRGGRGADRAAAWFRSALVLALVCQVGLAPGAVAATSGGAGSLGALSTPSQELGSAAGRGHEVAASATRASGGAGRAPGKGVGQLAPFALHPRGGKPVVTSAAVGDGSHSFHAATSKRVSSTATSDLYQNADGSFTRIVSSAPVNFQAPDGSWSRIDSSLGRGADGRWHEKAGGQAVDFAASGSDGDLASVGFDASHAVSWSLAGAGNVAARVSGSQVTYTGVLSGTDLRLETLAGRVKESLVVHSAAAGSSWVFPLDLKGLTPRLAGDGSVQLVDGSGWVVARVPVGFAEDSSVDPGSGAHARAAVAYQLTTVGGVPALRMSVDAAWLADPARVFPVTVDPSFTASGTTYVEKGLSGDFSSNFDMDAGTFNGGTNVATSLLAFSGLGSALAGQRITSASLSVFDYWAFTCTAEPFQVNPVTSSWSVTGSKAWPGPSVGASIGSVTANPGAACNNFNSDDTVGTWMSVPLSTSTFNSWTTGGADNGLAITASGTDSNQWKRFDSDNSPNQPFLTLNYTADVPPQVDGQYPPNNYGAPTLTPELLASGHDPDNWPSALKYDFTVYSDSGTKLADSGQLASPDWVVPSGVLSWGQGYYWTVQDYDGYDWSSLVPTNFFTTTVPQPLITSDLSQNSDAHGFDPSVGNYTTSATDASVAGVGPVLSVTRDYNSLDPQVAGAFGAGWSSMLDEKATEVTDGSGNVTSVVVTYPTGQEIGFGRSADGSFASPQGRYTTLKKVAGGYTLTDKSGTVYTFAQAAGAGVFAISSVADYEGRALSFTYTGGTVSAVTSGVSGRALHLTWSTPSGASFAHVASVATDPATPGVPSSAQTWTYGYSGDELTRVCSPTSATACTTYGYGSGSHYPTSVLDANPHSYWRLGESSGSAAASSVLDNEQTDAGSYVNASLGATGSALPGSGGTAAGFDGSSSYVSLPANLVTASSYQGVSLWFKTTGAGVLFSYQDAAISAGTTSGNYTPALYVGSDGRLYGQFWTGAVAPVVSSGSVADGAWHQVVLSAGGSTQSMFLDGALVGSVSGQVQLISQGASQEYVGAGFWGGKWPDEPHFSTSSNTGFADYFSGSISDVAFYTHSLSGSVVAQQYGLGHAAAGVLTSITRPSGGSEAQIAYDTVHDRVAQVTDGNGGVWKLGTPSVTGSSQVYVSSVLGSGPQDYWRLADSGGTQPVNQVHGAAATYNSVTLGVAGVFGPGDVTAASLNGSSSDVVLPSGLFPAASSQELWFNTTSTGGVLLSAQSAALGGGGTAAPALWIGPDGRLRGLSPDTTPTGPLVSGLPGKCVDDAGGSDANGTHVQLWDCLPTSNSSYQDQSWTVFADGTVRDFGKCLDITGGSTGDGTLVELWDCNGGAGQKWQVTSTGALKNPASGRCLDDPNSTTTNGTQLQIWDCNGQQNQTWIQSVGATRTGPFTSGIAGKCIDDSAAGVANGTHVQLWDCVGNTSQSWTFNPDGTIRDFGKCLDITGGSTGDGTLVELWDCNGGAGQKWQVTSTGALKNPASGRCLDDPNSTTTNGTQLQIFDCNGGANQVWIQSLASSKAVNDGKWHHVVLTGSGVNQTLYLDGAQAGSTAVTTGTVNLQAGTWQYAYLGAGDTGTAASYLAPGTTVYFNGSLEEAAFYRSALSAGDVARHYAAYKGSLGSVASVSTVNVTDPLGKTLSYAYDPGNGMRALSVTDGTGAKTTYGYDVGGFLYTVTDPDGNVTTTGHDVRGNVVSKTTCQNLAANACSTQYFTYFPDDTTVSPPADARNDLTLTSRDARSSSASDTTYLTSYTYDAAGNRTGVTTPPVAGYPSGRTSLTVYTDGTATYPAVDSGNAPAGLVASATTPGGAVTRMAYFHNGDIASVTDPAGEVTRYSYDALGRVATKTVISSSYPNGLVTSYSYDGMDRVVSQTDPAVTDRVTGAVHTKVTTSMYDADGNLTSSTVADATGGDAPRTTISAYDAAGRLLSSTDPDGDTTTLGYDLLGDKVKQVDAAGTESDYTYDDDGHLLTTTLVGYTGDPANPQPAANLVEDSRAYDPAGRLASVTDSMGRVTSYTYFDDGLTASVTRSDPARGLSFAQQSNTYDAAGNLASQATNNGATITTYSVDAAGRTASKTVDPLGAAQTTSYTYGADDTVSTTVVTDATGASAVTDATYDPLGRVTSRTVHDDGTAHTRLTTSWTLDSRGLPTSMTDPNGNVTTYVYDEVGQQAVVTAPTVNAESDGGAPVPVHPVTTAGYNTFGEQVETSDANGNVTTTGYDADGRVTSTTLPSYTPPGSGTAITPVTTRAYDKLGQLASATDALGNTTSYGYDQLGDTATVTAPGGAVTHHIYDTNGELLSSTGPTGGQSQATYDYLGRQLTTTQIVRQPAQAAYTATSTYTAAGQLATATSPDGVTQSFTYDALGRQTAAIDGAGNTTRTQYNQYGVTKVTAPDGTAHTTGYDQAGRITTASDLDATGTVLRTTIQGYDANGNPIAATDALGHTTSFTYDAANTLMAESQPVTSTNSITTSFGYDAAGNRTRFTDGRSNAFLTTYNAWNLPQSQIEPATTAYPNPADRTFTTAYDADGRPATQTSPGNVVVTNTYDALGNLTGQTGTGAQAATVAHAFTYDAAGRMTSAAAPGGTDTFSYDDRGLLFSAAGPSGTSSFAYNGDGQMTTRADAAGTSSYGYDRAGRLSTLTDAATGAQLTYGYNNDSLPASIGYGTGGATRALTYNNLHELTGDTLTAPGGAVEASIAYGYDLNGDETSKTTTGFAGAAANTYTYDQAGRLTSWNDGTTTVGYAYDASSNRTQAGAKTFTYDQRNELTSDGTSTYSYTPRGTLSAVGTTQTTSDAFNRVITSGGQSYTYDSLDRAVTAGAATLAYTGPGNTLASDGTATYSRDLAGALTGIATTSGATLAYTDQHTDLVGQFTPTGTALTGSAAYDPLGNPIATADLTGNLGYQSGYTDKTTGQIDMAARWYNPATGQFTSRDTLGLSPAPASVSADRYAYADDNPLIATDPSGHCGLFDWGCYGAAITSTAQSAWNGAQDAWNNLSAAASPFVQPALNSLSTGLHNLTSFVQQTVAPIIHTATTYTHYIYDAYVAPVARATWHRAAATWHTITYAADVARRNINNAANAVKDYTSHAAAAIGNYATHHLADGIAIGAGILAYGGCLALVGAAGAATAGVGFGLAVGCGAVSGFVSGIVGAGISKWQQCSSGQSTDCSIGAYAGSILAGGLIGGVTGALGGAIAGPLSEAVGGLIGDALPTVLKNVISNGAAGATAGTLAGGLGGGLGYAASCAPHCSLGGAATAVQNGAIAGGLIGGFGGAIGGAFAKNTPRTGPADPTPTGTTDITPTGPDATGNGDEPPTAPSDTGRPTGFDHGPFHRLGSPGLRNQNPEVLQMQLQSQELWGREPSWGGGPTVQAYSGPLPAGSEPGSFEFYTNAEPNRFSKGLTFPGAIVNWGTEQEFNSGNYRPGMWSDGAEFAKMCIYITKACE